MEPYFKKEVDAEIDRILNKYKQKQQDENVFCTGKNLTECLEIISQELDYLDVSSLDEPIDLNSHKSIKNVLIQLVNSTYSLVNLYKDVKKQQDDNFEKNTRLFSDFKTISNAADNLRKELASKDKQIQLNKEKMTLNRIENSELKNKISDVKKEIHLIQKDCQGEKSRHKHEINKVVHETKVLQERFRKNCGEYVSNERNIVEVLDTYKENEEKHLEMIQKLQENNQLLLEEILTLKTELYDASFKNRSK